MIEMEEVWQSIPWKLILPLIVIQLLLMGIALIDIKRSHEVNGPKLVWVLIVLFISMLGPVLYFILGRRQS